MTALPSYFLQACQNIEPGADATNAKAAHAQVSATLAKSAALRDLGISPFLIGSYGRDVSIRRVKDVDVFGRMDKATDDLRPGRALDLFEEALLVDFGGRVERQARSFKVSFAGFDLTADVVPARPCGTHWEIPQNEDQDNRASWLETNPTELNTLTTAANARFVINNTGIYVPTVKLVRQVRRNILGPTPPGGFFLEVMTYWAFINGQPTEDSRAGYLAFVLNHIADQLPVVARDGLDDATMPGKKITTRAPPPTSRSPSGSSHG